MAVRGKVLIVEDDRAICSFMRRVLEANGYESIIVGTGREALSMLTSHCPDVVILDLGLPDMDGMDVLTQLRAWSLMPVVVVSARTDEREKVRALDAGADDYITKPFSVSELMARVEALARRVRRSATADDEQAGSEPDQLVSGPFVLDEKSRVLYKSGKPIDLTQVEFQIMELFFRNPGTALVREKILEGVWGKGYFGDVKIVDVNIRRLRMKVEDEPSSPQHILTVWGYGYRWNA